MWKNKRYFGVLTVIVLVVIILIAGCGGGPGSSSGSDGNVIPDEIALPTIPDRVFTITDYGADIGRSDNVTYIQKAIDACAAAGGGTVAVPSGTFLCGPLTLKSNINLELSSGAILKLLAYGDYPNSGSTSTMSNFLQGTDLHDVEISGTGTIEGQGAAWWSAYTASKSTNAIKRPCVIRLNNCTKIKITGIVIQNAPNVHITIGSDSSDTTISNVTISAPASSPNTDGIDTWSGNINIKNCNISCGDDNIAMDNNSKNITITDCVFGSGHGCSIGSYAANINKIVVNNCSFNKTTNGIRLKSNRDRGGTVRNLAYSNLTMTGVTNPIVIVSYYPSTPSKPSSDSAQTVTGTTPGWSDITLRNIIVIGSKNAGILWGLPELSISDLTFDNVKISASKGMKAYFVSGAKFINGSAIAVSRGNAITLYSATISGINATSGQAE
jgi:polygalacturonase